MDAADGATAIAHTIQLAVAPVFLLSGLGMLLNLFAGRLARVIDRSRWIEQRFDELEGEPRLRAQRELRYLDQRMRIVGWSIGLCVLSCMAVWLVVAGLFIARLLGGGFARPVAFLFILAMALLVAALALFMLEVRLAARTIRVRNELMEKR